MISRFSFPTPIVFGPGALAELGVLAEGQGMRRLLVVTDKGVVRAGIVRQTLEALGSGMETAVFDDVEPNPTERNIADGAVCYADHASDGIVAVGGGSAMDAGKAVALRVRHSLPLERYDDLQDGWRLIGPDIPPVIAIPTTAGTGSEVGRSAVITLKATNRKTVIFSPYLMPKIALCDPLLTLGLPSHVTAATGADALTHCIEAYLASGYHPLCDAIAVHGAMLAHAHLPMAVHDGATDVEARTQMMMAALMGATAFQKGLGVAHSLAHPLSSVAGVPHGLANAVLLPYVLRFNAKTVPERLRDLGEGMGLPIQGIPAEEGARILIKEVERLLRAIDIPLTLFEIGVREEMIPALVAGASADGCHLSNPRPCTADDFRRLYEAALYGEPKHTR